MQRAITATLAAFDIPDSSDASIGLEAVEGDIRFPERFANAETARASADYADSIVRISGRHVTDVRRRSGLALDRVADIS